MAWVLKNITLSNMLGFFGEKQIHFINGLQVIEAHNHTGKTSLATALFWGLTGKVPASRKIKNKLVSDKDSAIVQIVLENEVGEFFEIRRSTTGTGITSQLAINVGGQIYRDSAAEEVLSHEIGLKAKSIEGGCVVLQDQRLGLIAGDLTESSKIIHDILGLSTLSKLVPIIKENLKVINKLVNDNEGKDLVKKWEERHLELQSELKLRENEAIAKGNDPGVFKSNFLEKEFSFLSKKLELPMTTSQNPKEVVSALKNKLNTNREQNPYRAHQNQFSKKLFSVESALKKLKDITSGIQEINFKYKASLNHDPLKMSEIDSKLQEYGFKIAAEQSTLDILKEQNSLLSHSLSLLKKTDCANACPLCEQSIDKDHLLINIENKLGSAFTDRIKCQETNLKQLLEEKNKVENLKLVYKGFENSLKIYLLDSKNVLSGFEKIQAQIATLNEPFLDQITNVISCFEAIVDSFQSDLNEMQKEHGKIEMMSQDYMEEFKALEDKLDNLVMYLIPVDDVHKKILDHSQRRIEQLSKGQAHTNLLEQAKSYVKQYEALILLLQTQEKNKANQLILEHQAFVTDFFVKVADNPNYDRITITSKEDRGSIKYDFQASSTKVPHLSDSAKHVLSGGDLSVACLGLMLSLIKGKSNKAGFIVLDDPGESFDAIRIKNFAKEIQKMAGHQTIILTHQADFAENLKAHGASSLYL